MRAWRGAKMPREKELFWVANSFVLMSFPANMRWRSSMVRYGLFEGVLEVDLEGGVGRIAAGF